MANIRPPWTHRFPSLRWKQGWTVVISIALVLLLTPPVQAFCGFFVAKAGGTLENTASQVVIAHSGDRSVFMMANDFQGDVKDFARIVPIPVIPSREQVRIGDGALMEKLSAFTAPRLAQYFDQPCQKEYTRYLIILPVIGAVVLLVMLFGLARPSRQRIIEFVVVLMLMGILVMIALPSFLNQANKAKSPTSISVSTENRVTVEDQFTVGEYDVSILSATESDSLVAWLQQNDYQVSTNASAMLQSYVDDGMKFFVVRVNLAEFQKTGGQFLRPIVLDYESDRWMLPIRLGTLNATADQDLLIHILSPDAYGETVNYKTVTVPTDTESGDRWPSGQEVPAFVQDEFEAFYQAVFDQAHERQGKNAVFLEYAGWLTSGAGNFNKCDPCTVPPEDMPTVANLADMGAWWSNNEPQTDPDTYITRLHLRYNQETFPEDLMFHPIGPNILAQKPGIEGRRFPRWAGVDFQARYVIRRPLGTRVCVSRFRYRQLMHQAGDRLAALTGWELGEIRQKMKTERRLNALDRDGYTPLNQAIASQDIQRVTALLEQGANPNISAQRWGLTALGDAIADNQLEMVRLLLAHGADANAKAWRGTSMLQWAIAHAEDTNIIQLLLDAGANVESPDNQGQTAWDYAQQVNNPEIQDVLRPYVTEYVDTDS